MKLEKHLVLNEYFSEFFLNFFDFNKLGINSFDKLKMILKNIEIENNENRKYNEDKNTMFFQYFDEKNLIKEEFRNLFFKYDSAIVSYVKKINEKRKNLSLKYFQYLAILFTEIFLDNCYGKKGKNREEFLKKLNNFRKDFNTKNQTKIHPFEEKDLKKLAFWMATGSGKTLIMHINYLQMLERSKDWDNVILITPNEGLSKQHYEELNLSGIPCKLYDGNINNLKTQEINGIKEILIIDIYKLTQEKKGRGVSVDISYFDGKNLVFIDEGHKGQITEEKTWKNIREKIAEKGFIFEYSATFGQIIGKNNELLEEYAKSIIFDYSYKYFYKDGYGKDFYVYNINIKEDKNKKNNKEEANIKQIEKDYPDLLLTAGLLSFYEQLAIFEKEKEKVKEYNIEKPLWVFVGSKVSGNGVNSDVKRIIEFLSKVLQDESYLKNNIEKIIGEESDDQIKNIFQNKFKFIREQFKNNNNKIDIDSLINDIHTKVFGGKGTLKISEIKNADGELGLYAVEGKYFGVINVGDVGSLKKLIGEDKIEKEKKEHFDKSLFSAINERNSNINILIGSKKFIEGWNSWRVSTMGLINMGQSEGPQIIQLFGRGVRLKGKDYSLKREENPDDRLKTLQTLFVFGLNANYINAFLSTLEKEDVKKEEYEEIEIPIKFNRTKKWEGKIYNIKTKDDFDFVDFPIYLTKDDSILRYVKIDLRPQITMTHGSKKDNKNENTNNKDEQTKIESENVRIGDDLVKIHEEYLNIIDWDFVYSKIMNYKIINNMYNLIIDINVLKEIIKSNKYSIFLSQSQGIDIEKINDDFYLKVNLFEGIKKLHDIILMILENYIHKFYTRKEKEQIMNHLEVEPLTRNNVNMYPEDGKIVLKIPKDLIGDIQKINDQLKNYDPNNNKMPDEWKDFDNSFVIHFDEHLYTPLIIWKNGQEAIKSMPVKLNEGETKFITEFQEYLNKDESLLRGHTVFLLRNLSKRGIGFFTKSGFYPDFIIWIDKGNKQHMIFIDPKGIRNIGNFKDDKIQFCSSCSGCAYCNDADKTINIKKIEETINIKKIEETIKDKLKNETEDEIKQKLKEENINLLQLDAFILSVTSFKDIKESFANGNCEVSDFENHNIVFQDGNYLNKIFDIVFKQDEDYLDKIEDYLDKIFEKIFKKEVPENEN